jgi:hypothetical protein
MGLLLGLYCQLSILAVQFSVTILNTVTHYASTLYIFFQEQASAVLSHPFPDRTFRTRTTAGFDRRRTVPE